ncbi:Chromosome partition protein Smc [uncultured Eubacterium sp.]|nr:Chromosome partition protein Smc [uncultured Eubacterium sp.]
MYLKSIEVNGFKSFAHKMIFKFEHGITGIVGPNGSGKSNVADAVRWVLGEQRAKQLRGSKMEDVIFAGTELRKPMGSAYVAITLDNSDHSLPIQFEEVTVARRVYRSGESEYLINGSACRRKDIVELFFDTGIGKEGYSIIGQGQIEQILSGKPEDRRELFDEAAGIVKYKKNKLETQKSLEIERENLVRVTDILAELERQVGPLKKQSERAREYLLLRDQLKDEDVKQFLFENRNLEQELKDLNEKIEIAQREMEQADQALSKAKEKYGKQEEFLDNLKQEIETIAAEISEMKITKQQKEGQIQVLKEQINTERMRENMYLESKDKLFKELNEKKAQLKRFEAETEEIRKEYESVMEQKIQKESEVALYQKQIQDLEREQEEIQIRVNAVREGRMRVAGAIERSQTVKEQLNVRISGLEHQMEELQQQIKQHQDKKDFSIEKIKEIKDKKDQLEIQRRNAKRIEETLLSERRQIQVEMDQKREKYHRIRSNYETMRNMAERYDGYGFGIKKVMEQQAVTPGIIGAVADIIKVEAKYETAIETALGGSIQNIVTDTQETAKKMIGYLKKNRYGRVTFLPLDAVKGKEFTREEILSESGVIGAANQLAEYDEAYKDLFASLLGQILVVEDMDAGIRIANKYHHSIRIVTLEGDSLNRGGSMSGGAFKNKSNLLGRAREVEELKGRLDKWTKAIGKDEEKYNENEKKLKEYQQNMVDLEKEIQEISLELNTQQMSQSAIESRQEELAKRQEQLVLQRDKLIEELGTAKEDADRLQDEQTDLESANEQDEERIKEIDQKLEYLRKCAEKHAMEVSKVHMRLSQESQKLEFQENNQERVRSEIEHLNEEFKENQKDAGDVNDNVKALKQQIEDFKDSCKEMEQKIITDQTRHQKMQEEVKTKEVLYKDILKEREEMMERVSGYDKEIYRLESQRDGRKQKKKELLDYMWENYEITYHQAKQRIDLDETESLSKIKETIGELKNQIKDLGPVNINAIEDYKEVSERYEFMQKQHEDIVTAEAHLAGLMEELEEAMRRQFNEKFKDIQRVFQEVFVELFGGGEARLELTDDDVLESGIRIIAQPPGKKLQNMMQLSGGEKALTAISLLFAIQNLKPSPFCLLDEIEAALDDSNVTRFAKYLHKLTKDTQFIVITHRRGTMMAADVLYGITMQEKGISTQVSVNLIENDLDE